MSAVAPKMLTRESKTVMRRVSDNALAFSHVSFETLWVHGPSELGLV